MISAHFKTKIEANDGLENSMLCMVTSDNNSEKKNTLFCSVCNKKGHSAYKDGKPFCYVLKNKLKQLKENNTTLLAKTSDSPSGYKGKCFKCGERGHMKNDCPKDTNTDEQDLNSLFIGCVLTNEKKNASGYVGS